MPKVLISDKMSPRAKEVFEEQGLEVDVITGKSPEELKAIIGDYDGLAIRSATKVTEDILGAAKNLKVIARAGIGVDNIDIPAASARGVVVMNTPFGNSITTAEHAIAMMFAVARQIPEASVSTHAGKWEKSRFMGTEVTGKTLGLIGAGNIGSIVADRAKGLKMKVIASDPFLSDDKARDMGVEKVELDELFSRADFITLHVPLTDKTRNILSKENIAKCKQGVYIINCARGGLIDEAALKEAIESGHVKGAAIDVFAEEPAKENVLFGLEQVVCTPHLGASTEEAQVNVAVQVAEQISDYLLRGTVTNALNLPSVSEAEAERLKPYQQLAEQLGAFAGQLTQHGLKNITIEYQGDVTKLNTKPLTAILLKGLLSPMVSTVNMINAPLVAKERNIGVKEVTSDNAGDYKTLVSVTVETDERTRTVDGTLFEGKHPRVVEVNGVPLEANLGRFMLYINNEDKPGLIGNLGKLLGDKGVNIANFHLGRSSEKDDAIALVQVDQEIDAATEAEIAKLPSVKQAKLLSFS